MDSRIGSAGFAFAMTWRTLLAAALVLGLSLVLMNTRYYATALVLSGLAALTILDATRFYGRLSAASAALAAPPRRDQARQLDHMAGLLDTVTVALIAVSAEGQITFANRAARLLAGEEVGRLADIRVLGECAARTIAALPPGARQIVPLEDGRTMLVWVGIMSSPGLSDERLISLQAVTGELDAVQVKAWSDMTRVLSHELMNSLTPISSLAESLPALLQAGDGTSAIGAGDTIARRSRQLLNFVERYRKIADLPTPQPRAIAVKDVLSVLEDLVRQQFSDAGISYRSNVSVDTINADPELLSHALLNLLRNAADAVQGVNNPLVRLDCALEGSDAIFTVSDNGPGIALDQISEVFVPFFTTKPNGSGIGLTLARQVALAHGGRISAENDTSAGAKLILVLPQIS